jgi:exopolysaccharide production protein ExoQ
MSRLQCSPIQSGRVRSSAPILDKYAIMPMLACAYALIVFPLIIVTCSPTDPVCLLAPRPENKIFWPAMAAISFVLVARDVARLRKLRWPPHVLCLFAYLSFAGVSVLWAFNPELSFTRFAQQAMIVFSVLLPGMLANRTADMIRGLFLCFALASILNIFFVLGRPPIDFKHATFGYPGYFSGKNYLGECAALAVLLSIHEIVFPGFRRKFGIFILTISALLIVLSNSKTSMGLVLLVPVLAGLTLYVKKLFRISPAIILLSIPLCYLAVSTVFGFTINRVSYMLYGDPTFTGRTIIWDFANYEIGRRPLLGWGYQSFWLAGRDAPSITDAPGWVKTMPNAHNGYLDTMIEMGYIGFSFLLAFIITTLHAIGRLADRDPVRAWIVLSLALFVIITNGLESSWMRGFEMVWVLFLILAAEIALREQSSAKAVYRSVRRRTLVNTS